MDKFRIIIIIILMIGIMNSILLLTQVTQPTYRGRDYKFCVGIENYTDNTSLPIDLTWYVIPSNEECP